MFASPQVALVAVERVIAVAVILQTLELWLVRRVAADDGVWRWPTMRQELPARGLLDLLLGYRGFLVLLAARLAAAVALVFVPHLAMLLVLLATSLLVSLRWRGSVNGGSDFMTLVVLSALAVAAAFPTRPMVAVGCLWYIAIQACNSYFLAGLVKLKSAAWRDGRALPAFLAGAVHDPTVLLRALSRPWLARAAGYFVIALECSFPLALFRPEACAVLVGLALVFHVANVYVFGLNRFLWAWAATYPALFYCSQAHLGG